MHRSGAPVFYGEGKCSLLILDVLVHGLGGCLTGTHGLDDGGGTGHGIAAGVHALTAGLALVALGDDAAVLVGLQAGSGGADQAVGLVDYNRYIYTYYIGWFFMALACWSTALQTADGEQKAPARRWIALAGQAGVLLMAAAMLVRVNGMILPQLSVLGFSDGEFADRKTARAEADWLCSDYLNENDRVFFVSQGDNGEHWFSAVFDFYPVLVDYSGVGATQEGGGGTFGLPELEPQEEGVKQRYYHPYTAERLDETVRANGCTVLYLQKIDDIFVQSYQNLFTDHLAAAQAGQTLLYRVTDAGYEPVTMQMSKEAAQ